MEYWQERDPESRIIEVCEQRRTEAYSRSDDPSGINRFVGLNPETGEEGIRILVQDRPYDIIVIWTPMSTDPFTLHRIQRQQRNYEPYPIFEATNDGELIENKDGRRRKLTEQGREAILDQVQDGPLVAVGASRPVQNNSVF